MSPTNHAATTDPPPDAEIKLLRRFVYGLNYIDELVAQITPATTTDDGGTPTPIPSHVRFVLQGEARAIGTNGSRPPLVK